LCREESEIFQSIIFVGFIDFDIKCYFTNHGLWIKILEGLLRTRVDWWSGNSKSQNARFYQDNSPALIILILDYKL